jgi:hypothetical protein
LISVPLLLACPLAAAAQTYTIKLKTYPDAGMTVTVRDTEKATGSMKIFDADGKLLNEAPAKGLERAYALTVLTRKGNAPPEKYKRVYTKATETQGGKARALSYQGRTVVFEKKGGTFRVGVVGAPPLDEKDLDKLIEKANDDTDGLQDRLITPTKAVAVGDRWAIDPKAFEALLKGAEVDLKASRAEGKLVKAYTKGKSQFGVIEVNLKLAVKRLDKDVPFDPPATVELKATIDTAIDGSSTARTETHVARFKGKAVFQQGERKGSLEIDETGTGHSARSEEKAAGPAELKVPAVRLIGPDGDWTELTSKEGRFSVVLPGTPRVSKKEGKGSTRTTWEVVREKGNLSYAVMTTDYKRVDKVDPKLVLTGIADSFAKETKKKRAIELNGFPGVELVLEQDGGKVILTYRAYFVKGRLYQVMVAHTPGLKDKAQARRFFDSFKLHDRAPKPRKDDA